MKTTFDGIEMDLHDDGSGGLPAAEYDPLRTPYDVREQDFPGEKSFSDQLWFLLHYAVLAPSTHNTQPWRFAVLESEGIALYADYSRRMPVIDPGNRELVISLGAALFNLRVAAAHFAMPCEIAYNLSGDSENSRKTINAWVEQQTKDKIKDLLPPGSIHGDTRMVLSPDSEFFRYFVDPSGKPRESQGRTPAASK